MQNKNLKVALVQSDLHWEDKTRNLEMFSEKLSNLESVDLIVLPEMFTTGFTMESEKVAEKMSGEAVAWMREMAVDKNAVIGGSLIIEENGNYHNRFCWVSPDGVVQTYDKRHLFRMAGEHEHFSMGESRLITNLSGWRCCPQVCYDLRFPVWSRNSQESAEGPAYDVLIYVANWPEARADAWFSLLKARAIENQAYVIGVNRVGKDGKEIPYSGHSAAFGPKGERLDQIEPYRDQIEVIELNWNDLEEFRKKFPVSMDADQFRII